MERSLSVLLPLQNVESSLVATVHRMLEIAADLTDRFELIIVDDGSTDATSEVAEELARRYPQVKAARHRTPRGRAESVRTGLRLSRGQVVIQGDPADGEAPEELARTWASVQSGAPPAAAEGRGYRVIDQGRRQLHGPSPPAARPAYVARLREFVLGE